MLQTQNRYDGYTFAKYLMYCVLKGLITKTEIIRRLNRLLMMPGGSGKYSLLSGSVRRQPAGRMPLRLRQRNSPTAIMAAACRWQPLNPADEFWTILDSSPMFCCWQ
jgi:hypothetical protein